MVRRGTLSALLCRRDRAPWLAAGTVLSIAADRLFRRLGRGTRHRVARGRFLRWSGQGQDDRHRRDHVGSDAGYHSNQVMVDLEAVGVRSYISEPDRGRRNWQGNADARDAVYRNRRRIRGARGKRLLRQRGERLERPCAHLYETGRMRRVHLRGHDNIRKRLLVHAGALNLGLLMRTLLGIGTPRGLQGRAAGLLATFWSLLGHPETTATTIGTRFWPSTPSTDLSARRHADGLRFGFANAFATGC